MKEPTKKVTEVVTNISEDIDNGRENLMKLEKDMEGNRNTIRVDTTELIGKEIHIIQSRVKRNKKNGKCGEMSGRK